MAFYDRFNEVIAYLESHLDCEVNYSELARRAGTNTNTLLRVFPLLTDITIADYLRRRRLTLAGRDLIQSNFRVIDIATKYGYASSAAFSRAFTKFHGVKPSEVKYNSKLKYYPKLVFTRQNATADLEYEVIELDQIRLYGIGVKTDEDHIRHDAPEMFTNAKRRYPKLGCPEYGMVIYNDTRDSSNDYEYWTLWRQFAPGLTTHIIPARRWLKFRIPSWDAKDIQAMSDLFYKNFLPTCTYELTPDPELEYYHDGVTDFLIPIR